MDLSSGALVRTLPAEQSSDPDAEVLGTFSDDGLSEVSWVDEERTHATRVDLDSGARERVRLADRSSQSLGFIALPTGVAQRWADGAVTLYDLRGRRSQVLDAHRSHVNDIVVSPDHTWAASVDDRGGVLVWDIDRSTGQWSQRESLVGHDGAVTGVSMDADGRSIVTVSRDGTAIAWDMSAEAGFGSPVQALGNLWVSNRPQSILTGRLAVAPARPAAASDQEFGRRVAVSALFFDPVTGEVADTVSVGSTVPGTSFGSSVAVSPDRTKVAVTYGYGTVVLDARTRRRLARIELPGSAAWEGRPEPVWCAAWTPDGTRLLLGAAGTVTPGQKEPGDSLVVVDTKTWTARAERVDVGGVPQAMEVSPDGASMAAAMTIPSVNDAPPGSVHILDARTLAVRRVLRVGLGHHPFDLSYSPDGRLLAVVDDQGTVTVFDVRSGERLRRPVRVHDGMGQQVEWLPGSGTLVTSGTDGMLALYDVDSGVVAATLPGSSDGRPGYTYVTSVTPTAITAFTADRRGRSYSLDLGTWLDYACALAARDLTPDEWSTYLPGRGYERTCGDQT